MTGVSFFKRYVEIEERKNLKKNWLAIMKTKSNNLCLYNISCPRWEEAWRIKGSRRWKEGRSYREKGRSYWKEGRNCWEEGRKQARRAKEGMRNTHIIFKRLSFCNIGRVLAFAECPKIFTYYIWSKTFFVSLCSR